VGRFGFLLRLSWVNRSTQMARIECPKDTTISPRYSGTCAVFRSYTGEMIMRLLFLVEAVCPEQMPSISSITLRSHS
jgi:hypothetical protein